MNEGIVKTSVTENGIEKEFQVEEVSNGFVVKVISSGYKNKGTKNEEWFHDVEKYISTTNPLTQESVDIKTMISDALKNLTL